MIAEWARQEMNGAAIPDARRRHSLARLCTRLATHPELSFSKAAGSAGRQAAYRIFQHPHTSMDYLLQGHFQQTAARCSQHALVLALQDTTDLDYSTHPAKAGLGYLDQRHSRGLLAHAVLAATTSGTPLGLLHLHTWVRDLEDYGKSQQRRYRDPTAKESHKWARGLQGLEEHLPAGQAVLLIQDREADVFDFVAQPRRPQTQLLIRTGNPRQVVALPVPTARAPAADQRRTLTAVVAAAPVVGAMTVTIPRQPGQPEREATLELRCAPVRLLPPPTAGQGREPQEVWVVQARETTPPPSADPVQWVLLTTMPVTDAADARQLVQYYARRWLIERLHYTLKSGCGVERLQIDNRRSLEHALALFYVVAWRLLYLTLIAREEPDRPATTLLSPEELTVLAQALGQPPHTAREVVQALARVGGFEDYRHPPPPGVKSLWQGLRRLEDLVAGWRLAWAAMAGDEQ